MTLGEQRFSPDLPRQEAAPLTARMGASVRHVGQALRRRLPVIVASVLLLWLAVVAAREAMLALQPFGISIALDIDVHLDASWRPSFSSRAMVAVAAVVFACCLGAALLTRLVWARATLPVTFAVGAIALLAAAISTGSVGALVFVVMLVVLAWLVGDALLSRFLATPDGPLVRAPIAIALGLGLLGMLLFGLATLGALNMATVLGGAGAILVVTLASERARWRDRLSRARSWRPQAPSWFETVIAGASVGIVAFALVWSFVPETISDAVWQHLPIAREIWQTGAAPEFAYLEISREPIQAHLFYAAGYGFAGIAAVKLVHVVAGLTAIAGIAGIGWLCSGRLAAVTGAALFATMPLVLWLLGHALIDLFTILFTVTATLCVLLWQRDGGSRWLLCAGALAGFGFATKLNMGLTILALAGAIFLVGRGPWQTRARVLAVLIFGVGAVVFVPWLLRSYAITGTVSPKLAVLVDSFTAVISPGGPADAVTAPAAANPFQVYNPHEFSLGHSPLDLLRIPWFVTFHADEHRFLVVGRGEVGMLLLLLPLALLAPRTRATGFLAVTMLVSYVGWVFSPFQIIRHLLPTLAIAAPLAGMGIAAVMTMEPSGPRRLLAKAVPLGVVVGILAAPVFFLSGVLTRLPVDVLLGRETAVAFLAREIPSAAALAAATERFPPDTVVGYFGRQDGGAQIYTEARLTYVEPNNTLASLGDTAEEILESLDRLGIRYFIWNREGTRPEDWQSGVLATGFLSEHTRILAGDRNGYLFEVLPHGGQVWGTDRARNLLDDPDLSSVGREGPWTTVGKVKGRQGAAVMPPKTSLVQEVSISGGRPYLFVANSRCTNPDVGIQMALRWFDAAGVEIGIAAETVITSKEWSERFLWRVAPVDARSVLVQIATVVDCEFDDAALYALS
jgi:4-amino-4-deoxy-L-arabinose transferase-like glycosyltransferase